MTPREQRTVRLGAVAGAAILLYVLILDPYLTARAETRDRIEEREAQLTRLQALDESQPLYRQRLAAAERIWESEVRPRLLPADIPNVAASALSEEVRRIATQSYLAVERENVLAPTEEAGLTGIPVQFSLRGDIYGLRDFLGALESTRTFLNLRELRVTTTAGGFQQLPAQSAPLQITVTIEGYLGGVPAASEGPAAIEAGGPISPIEPGAGAALGPETGTPAGAGGGVPGAGEDLAPPGGAVPPGGTPLPGTGAPSGGAAAPGGTVPPGAAPGGRPGAAGQAPSALPSRPMPSGAVDMGQVPKSEARLPTVTAPDSPPSQQPEQPQ